MRDVLPISLRGMEGEEVKSMSKPARPLPVLRKWQVGNPPAL